MPDADTDTDTDTDTNTDTDTDTDSDTDTDTGPDTDTDTGPDTDTDTGPDTSGQPGCNYAGMVFKADDGFLGYDLCWEDTVSSAGYWTTANSYCEDRTTGGFDDWRLPTISELRSIVINCSRFESGGACAITDGCTDAISCDHAGTCIPHCNVGPDFQWDGLTDGNETNYWSSTGDTSVVGFMWSVNFFSAYVGAYDVTENWRARCVRDLP